MTTCFFYYQGVSPAMLRWVILPHYHSNIQPLPGWRQEQPGLWSLGLTFARSALMQVNRIIPCCSVLNTADYGFQFHLQGTTVDGDVTSWYALSPIGMEHLAGLADMADNPWVSSEIDLFTLHRPLISATMKVTLSLPDGCREQEISCLISVVLAENFSPGVQHGDWHVDLDIPLKSQRVEDQAIQNKICSPTCLSMVLDYFGCRTTVAEVARKVYHPQHQIYGNWPANIRGASLWGMGGYLLRFCSWEEVAWFLARGIPIIASISYRQGELSQAAIDKTTGHLVVLRGLEPHKVLVNDPASYEIERVSREYQLDEMTAVWLARNGMGYIIFRLKRSPAEEPDLIAGDI